MKFDKSNIDKGIYQSNYSKTGRLNLNDLLQKKLEEKNLEKKNNLLIFSGTLALGIIVVAFLVF